MVRTGRGPMRPYVTGDSGTMGRSARKQGLYDAPVVWLSARLVAGPRFGRRDDNSGMGVCRPVSGSTCAPGVVDVAIIPPDKSAGTNTSGTATPATCWCTGSRSTTCRHGFSCAIPSQGLEDPPQVRSGCSAGWTAAVDQRPSVGYDRHDCRIAEDIGRVIAMPHRFQLRRTTEQE